MARMMDFVHDDSGSHVVKAAKQSAVPDDDEDDDLLNDVKEGPEEEPYEESPDPEEESEPEVEDEGEDEPEEKPEPKAAKRKDHLKVEMDRLVAESQRATALEARLRDQERRAQIADLNSIKSHAALRAFEFENVKRQLDEAIELGEVARQSELRDKYHDLRNEMSQAAAFIRQQEQMLSRPQAPPQAEQPPPNPRAVAWTKKQAWWGTDEALTAIAYVMDEKLIKEGVNPYTDQFYRLLEQRLAPYMPRSNRRRQAVASVETRTAPNARGRKVKLEADHLDMARRLGVPPAEYAKYVGL